MAFVICSRCKLKSHKPPHFFDIPDADSLLVKHGVWLCDQCTRDCGATMDLFLRNAPAPKPALKLEIGRYKNLVFGQVLGQAEELRNNPEVKGDEDRRGYRRRCGIVLETGRYVVGRKRADLTIESIDKPDLVISPSATEPTILQLRGRLGDADNDAFCCSAPSRAEAVAVVAEIKRLVQKINARIPGEVPTTKGRAIPMEIAQ